MSPVTFYETSVGLYVKAFDSLIAILNKLKAHAGNDADSYVSARLADDMLPLSFQVQTASNTSKKALERLIPEKGPFPVWEDNEKTVDELIARAEKTLALLKTVTPEDLAGKEGEVVEIKLGPQGTATAEGKGYALGYALPNVFFHLATAYAILRMKGVSLGKRDFLTPFLEPNLLTKP